MKVKKATAAVLAAVLAFGVFLAPASGLQTKAEIDWSVNPNVASVYSMNITEGTPKVAIHTPAKTVKMYAGISWDQLDMDMGARLNVTKSGYGPVAQAATNNLAAALGAKVVMALDMDMEKYLDSGWTEDVEAMLGPVRISITLPYGSDLTKDYAVISIRENGRMEVLGDLDLLPETLTVDSTYFDTFVIISGNKGAFDAYKVGYPDAVSEKWAPHRVRSVGSTILKDEDIEDLYSIGVSTTRENAIAVIGDWNPVIKISRYEPGPNAKSLMQYTINKMGVQCSDYHEIYLSKANGQRITSTALPMHINLSVPRHYPAYADYAVMVLHDDGSLSIAKDVIPDDGMITIATNQFMAYAIMWGPKGAFDKY